MHKLALALVTAVVLTLALAPVAPPTLAQANPVLGLEVSGSPLVASEGRPALAGVTLARPSELRLRVVDFDGHLVAELYRGSAPAGRLEREWSGLDRGGEQVPFGPYRLVATATADGVTERAESWVTVAPRPVYPEAPGFITVAVDPGHGGDYDGAVAPDGTREADIDLDIALRLATMLEAAGVGVVLTRTADAPANAPPEDRTGDRVIDGDDELAARPDAANEARADLFLAIHNNIAVNPDVGGPSTFYFDERAFGDRNERLARIVQEEMMAGLARFAGDGWEPHDHGALIYPYYVLRGFDPPRLRRPTQMPGVLSEGLFLSNPRELALLARADVRGAMAAAYYQAVAKYLARRGPHLGYALVEGPTEPVEPGSTVSYAIEVRNQGSESIRDWRLVTRTTPARPRYIGRLGRGTPAGRASIPRLDPGQSAIVDLDVTAPTQGGTWALVVDARDGHGKRASSLGVPPLQTAFDTLEPAPAAEPASSAPSGGPAPGPTAASSPSATPNVSTS
jgi:N-acetylmuramoyl-L-alanine amidase